MSYDNEVVKICRLTNGWELEIFDPPPKEKKAEEKAAQKGNYVPSDGFYVSPWRTMAFADFDSLIEFLEKKGADLKPRNFDEEYATAFDKAVKSMSKEPAEKEGKGKT